MLVAIAASQTNWKLKGELWQLYPEVADSFSIFLCLSVLEHPYLSDT